MKLITINIASIQDEVEARTDLELDAG